MPALPLPLPPHPHPLPIHHPTHYTPRTLLCPLLTGDGRGPSVIPGEEEFPSFAPGSSPRWVPLPHPTAPYACWCLILPCPYLPFAHPHTPSFLLCLVFPCRMGLCLLDFTFCLPWMGSASFCTTFGSPFHFLAHLGQVGWGMLPCMPCLPAFLPALPVCLPNFYSAFPSPCPIPSHA